MIATSSIETSTSPPKKLSNTIYEQARAQSAKLGVSIWNALSEITELDARALNAEVASYLGMPSLDTPRMLQYVPAFDVLPLSKAMQRQCVILRDANGVLSAIISDPFDTDIYVWLQNIASQPIEFGLSLKSDIQAYLSKQEESVRATDGIISSSSQEKRENKAATKLSFESVSELSSPAVKLVNATLYDALKAGASDIHLESTATGLTVKYRIDGVLDHITALSGNTDAEQVISRLKVLAELDISERRVPQDGSFSVEVNEREIDLRLSIMPSIHGEDAVIRILDKRAMIEAYGALNLESLGFDTPSLVTLRALTEEAYGMLLVTGPTGSGKTTTLYAALSEINTGREKIITIEDPVEYQLPGILQIPVNEKKGLTFAKGLRSILRHDPDKIMVGEIRDKETAEIAVQSALTGHIVLTTVHANNVFDVFGRFTHMGIDPYAFVSALNGIWAQRLVRLNCPHCSIDDTMTSERLSRVNLCFENVKDFHFRRGVGCGDCRGTGYKGRRAIAEILTLTDEMREFIIEKKPIRQIKELAKKNGTHTLREVALELAKKGMTTLEEIKRVTLHA
ncbi:GspE/PulE family protein [Undibacterium sp. Dicai25W]|uniref:GspE/PulE family protein n=1 Tax=Undibacterium sp. Dicai25W TaxID=3413034 RepID=UPI003BF01FFF